MKISITQLEKLLLYFLIICNLSIIKVVPFFNKSVISHITLLFTFLFIFMVINKKDAINAYYKYYFLFIVVFFFTEFLYTIIRYNSPIVSICYSSYRYSYLLIAPMVFYLLKRISYNRFFNFLLFTIVLSCIMRIAASYYYGLTGMYIFGDMALEYNIESWMRNGVLRINLPCLILVFPAVLINHMINNKKFYNRVYQILCFLIAEYYVFFILQARAIMAYQVFIFVSFWIIKKKKKLKQLMMYVVLAIGVLYFVNTEYYSAFIASFVNDTNLGGSLSHRLLTIIHFFDLFKENVLFGIGFLSDVDLHSGVTSGHISDIGILGGVFHFGLLGIILYVVIFARWIYVTYSLYKNRCFPDFYNAFLLLVSTLLFGINIDPFYASIIFSVPIISGIIEFLFWKNIEVKGRVNNGKLLQ